MYYEVYYCIQYYLVPLVKDRNFSKFVGRSDKGDFYFIKFSTFINKIDNEINFLNFAKNFKVCYD